MIPFRKSHSSLDLTYMKHTHMTLLQRGSRCYQSPTIPRGDSSNWLAKKTIRCIIVVTKQEGSEFVTFHTCQDFFLCFRGQTFPNHTTKVCYINHCIYRNHRRNYHTST